MKYCFYPGCAFATSAGYKESFEAVIKELNLDFEEIEDWNCCGATVSKGIDNFKAMVLTGRIFALANKQGYSVITTGCNACYTTLQKAALKLSDTKLWAKVKEALLIENLELPEKIEIKHILEILVDIPKERWAEKRPDFIKDISVAPYYGCQLTHPHSNVGDPEKPVIFETLIKNLGFTLTEHSAGTMCCGASLAVPHEDKCNILMDRIIGEMKYRKADIVSTICPLCQFNLDNHSQDLPVTFITQLAGLSLGISPKKLGFNKLLTKATGIIK
jgi:heterodisulfide reductase subunit B